MADIFISYSRADRGRVAPVAAALEQGGLHPWWDTKLGSGEDYGMVIEREIAAASSVLVAWSATARQSLWVRAEANEALDAGKLVQLSLDASRLPLPFTMLHALDFSAWPGGREDSPWSDLETELRRIASGGGRREAERTEPAVQVRSDPLQGFGRVAWLGWAAIALAALVAVAAGLAAMGRLPLGLFTALTLFALAAAGILLAGAALLLARTATASRR